MVSLTILTLFLLTICQMIICQSNNCELVDYIFPTNTIVSQYKDNKQDCWTWCHSVSSCVLAQYVTDPNPAYHLYKKCYLKHFKGTITYRENRISMLKSCVHGGFTDWQDVSSCSVSCGAGTKTQGRSCTNPTPQGDGDPCSGATSKSIACNLGECPKQECANGPEVVPKSNNDATTGVNFYADDVLQ